MIETEWRVYCLNGHATYERLRGPMNALAADVLVDGEPAEHDGTRIFRDCPTCGAPRRAEQLLPPR